MLYTYNELVEIYKTDYKIKKAIADGKMFKIEKGIYSDMPVVSPLEIITKKYPDAIFTMDSAFYFHGLTDVIPTKIHLALRRDTIRINREKIIQVFVVEKLHEIGKTHILYEGVNIPVYNMERMLIELIRNKRRMAYDYYKEIIGSYRRRQNELDTERIEEYIGEFDIENYIFSTVQNEVF